MRKSAFYLIFYLVISVLLLAKAARAEDVYNFYFQKPVEKTSAEKPITTSGLPQATPVDSQPASRTWKLGFTRYSDTVLSFEGFNFAYTKFFGKNLGFALSASLPTKISEEEFVSVSFFEANKYDAGLSYFEKISSEISATATLGITTLHRPDAWEHYAQTVKFGTDIFVGVALEWNLGEDLNLELETKFLPSLYFGDGAVSYGYPEKFSQMNLHLIWKI